jgi:hypothetical protein
VCPYTLNVITTLVSPLLCCVNYNVCAWAAARLPSFFPSVNICAIPSIWVCMQVCFFVCKYVCCAYAIPNACPNIRVCVCVCVCVLFVCVCV